MDLKTNTTAILWGFGRSSFSGSRISISFSLQARDLMEQVWHHRYHVLLHWKWLNPSRPIQSHFIRAMDQGGRSTTTTEFFVFFRDAEANRRHRQRGRTARLLHRHDVRSPWYHPLQRSELSPLVETGCERLGRIVRIPSPQDEIHMGPKMNRCNTKPGIFMGF